MKKLAWLIVPVVVLGLAALPACSSDSSESDHDHDHDHGDLPPECQAIKEACHEKGVGTGRVSECHELSHAGIVADCTAQSDECIATCNAAPFPGGADAGDAG